MADVLDQIPKDDHGNILLADTHGVIRSVDPSEAPTAMAKGGWKPADPQEVAAIDREAKYGTTGQQVKTGLEHAASSATFGLSTGLETGLGIAKPEDIRARSEENSISGFAGDIAGLAGTALIPGVGEAAAAKTAGAAAKGVYEAGKVAQEGLKLGKLAEDVAAPLIKAGEEAAPIVRAGKEAINPLSAQSVMSGLAERAATKLGLEGESLGAQIMSGGTKGAIETALFQGGNEVSKMFQDPDHTVGAAAINVGLSGLLGAGVGGGLGAISPLWKATSGSGNKLGQFIEDFKGRVNEHLNTPDPVGLLGQELKDRLASSEAVFDEVYGPKGLKTEAIQKLMPNQLSDKMIKQTEELMGRAKQFSEEMQRNPDLYPKYSSAAYNRDLRILSDSLSEPTEPAQIFNAIQDFKQRLYENLPKRGEFPTPHDREFVKTARTIFGEFRNGLEDHGVWGKAAEVQQDINKAFTEYLTPKKQFEGKFTSKVGDERVIDPGKLQTYVNQSGKSGQKIKQEMLGNFLQADEKYRAAVNKTHEKLGLESPFPPSSLSYTKSTLEDLSSGAKFADVFIKKGLSRLAGESIGAGVGGAAGHAFGHGWIGALIGEHALGPFFNTILPALIKPILQKEASAEGLKAASDYGMAVIRGQKLLEKASKGIFKAGQEVLPTALLPEQKHLDKLDKKLEGLKVNAEPLFNIGGSMGHYFPDHAGALGKTAMNQVNYLNSLRPSTDKRAPLDSNPKPSDVQKATYQRALTIAEQPLVVLQSIKNGTLTTQDVVMLKNLNPALYDKLYQSVSKQMIEHLHQEEIIPYKTRMSLSLFMAQPLDSTMTPAFIMAAQAKPQMTPSQMDQTPHPKHSMSALNKLPGMYQTASQSREAHRSK